MKPVDAVSKSQTALGPMPTEPRARLKKAAESMEAIWLTQMLHKSRHKGGMLDQYVAAQTYRDMLAQAMGDSMAKAGVVGLADTLVRQLLGPEQKATLALSQAAKLQQSTAASEIKSEEPKNDAPTTKGSAL